ncbi:hypothetical protein HPP92_008546 [Vanilla planifolia]|uniref:Uncharacterized protein n=1 Tax=Vanilla planifolia TaxID=51239 RepID=A0A835RC60_VANPL|nr:hypothetical protein HPP92_008546 [Vanilla planifolia]
MEKNKPEKRLKTSVSTPSSLSSLHTSSPPRLYGQLRGKPFQARQDKQSLQPIGPSDRSIQVLENLKQRSGSRSPRWFGSHTRKTHSSIGRECLTTAGKRKVASFGEVGPIEAGGDVAFVRNTEGGWRGVRRKRCVGWTPSLESITEAD